MTFGPKPPTTGIPAHARSVRLPAVRVVPVSEQVKGEAALRVLDRMLANWTPEGSAAGAVEWAALKHAQTLVQRANERLDANPLLRAAGMQVELSPHLRAMLEGGR